MRHGTTVHSQPHHCTSSFPPNPQESADLPAVKKMLETAKQVLGYDLLELCNEGPKDKLDNTVYSQVSGELDRKRTFLLSL